LAAEEAAEESMNLAQLLRQAGVLLEEAAVLVVDLLTAARLLRVELIQEISGEELGELVLIVLDRALAAAEAAEEAVWEALFLWTII
jgi:hypothetical protein